MAETKDNIIKEENEPRMYEVGYLLVPTLSEDALPEVVSRLKDAIREADGAILGDGEPKMKNLAYRMAKVVGHDRSWYDTAYFGWILFTAPPEGAQAVKTAYDTTAEILRFLIIKGTKEDFAPKKRKPQIREKKQESGEGVQASSEAIDKAIEELVISE